MVRLRKIALSTSVLNASPYSGPKETFERWLSGVLKVAKELEVFSIEYTRCTRGSNDTERADWRSTVDVL